MIFSSVEGLANIFPTFEWNVLSPECMLKSNEIIQKETGSDFDSSNLIVFLYKWRKALLIVTVVAAVVSAAVSYIIKPKFKSTVVLFPASSASLSKSLLTENFGQKQDILQFGEEEESERMLQILNSDEIRSRICQKYNLMEHYNIDTAGPYKRTKLYEQYMDNITFKRTEFMSVKVEVLDVDPDTAALIANDISALFDSTHTRMQRERAIQAFKIVEKEYLGKVREVQQMSDSIARINLLGVYDYESQSEVTTEQLAIAISKGDQRAVKSLEEKLTIIAQYGSAYVSIRDNLELERKQLSLLQAKYNEAKVDAGQNIPHKFVVNRAYPAERKSYPVRWLIVLVSTVSTFILAMLVIILIENLSAVRLTDN